MSDYEIPKPEPKEIDSVKWLEWKDVLDRATLKGHPMQEERCDNCLYYLDDTEEISYCWHQQLRILVGAELVVPVVGEARGRGLIEPRRGRRPASRRMIPML